MPSPYSRRSTSGIAVITTLSVGINDSVEAFSIDDASGWPSGSGGAFYAQIDDEVIDCASQTAGAVTVVSGGRGASDTPAASHLAGATVSLVFTSADADDANYVLSETVGKVTATQDLLVADGAHSLTRLAITNNRALIVSGSTISWGQLTSAMLATDSVGSAQIAADAVGSSEIATNAVGAAELADDAVDTNAIANLAVTNGKLAATALSQAKTAATVSFVNLATTAPSATKAGEVWFDTDDSLLYVYNGTNWVCITPITAVAAGSVTTTSGTFGALSGNPAVSIVTGTKALVTVGCKASNDTLGQYSYMGFAVSGATTVAAQDGVQDVSAYATDEWQQGRQIYVTGLTAGTNVFTANYKRVSSGTSSFSERSVTVVGVP